MPKEKLTDRFVSTIKSDSQVDYFDTLEPGLALRVSPSRKTWSLMYTKPGSRQRARFTLGEYSDEYGLAKARRRARELKAEIADGVDPQATKQVAMLAAQKATTVRDLVDDYIARQVADRRSAAEIARRLRRNILDPVHGCGAIALHALHKRDIVKAIDAVADRGAKTEAARCFEDIRALVRWAVGRGVMDHDITAGMKAPPKSGARDRVLTPDEIKLIFASLDEAGMRDGVADVVRLLFETACRVSEIAGLVVAEVDFKAGLIRLPAPRVKNGLAHNVPLTDRAKELLARVIGKRKAGYLFSVGENGHLRSDVVANELAKAQNGVAAGKRRKAKAGTIPVGKWTAHDIRRTWATIASELRIPPHIIAAALNHQSVNNSVTFAHYVRNDFLDERREAHKAVSEYIAAAVA